MNSIKAYNHIKSLVDAAQKEWNEYNEPQKTYVAIQVIDLMKKIKDAAIYLGAVEYIKKFEDLYLLVKRYE